MHTFCLRPHFLTRNSRSLCCRIERCFWLACTQSMTMKSPSTIELDYKPSGMPTALRCPTPGEDAFGCPEGPFRSVCKSPTGYQFQVTRRSRDQRMWADVRANIIRPYTQSAVIPRFVCTILTAREHIPAGLNKILRL